MEDRDLLQANASMIAGTLLFSPFKENLIESNLLSCIINKRIVIALPIAAGIAVLAYIFSFQVGAYAAFPAIVAIAILGYAVSKPAWLIVERVTTSDYGNTPLLAISNADREYYASLVEALRKAEEVFMAHSETKHSKYLISLEAKIKTAHPKGFTWSMTAEPTMQYCNFSMKDQGLLTKNPSFV